MTGHIVQDKLIISGPEGKLVVRDKDGNNEYIKNDKFSFLEDFVIDRERGKMYFCNFEENKILNTKQYISAGRKNQMKYFKNQRKMRRKASTRSFFVKTNTFA